MQIRTGTDQRDEHNRMRPCLRPALSVDMSPPANFTYLPVEESSKNVFPAERLFLAARGAVELY